MSIELRENYKGWDIFEDNSGHCFAFRFGVRGYTIKPANLEDPAR